MECAKERVRWKKKKKKKCTFISLLLNLKLLRQILILLPLNRHPNRMIINEFASIIHFLSIKIRLFQNFVLKEIVGGKLEDDLVA